MEKILITPYFKTQDSNRNIELDRVLSRNLDSNLFEKIILFCDPGAIPPITDQKIEVIQTKHRSKYCDFFKEGNKHTNKIVVVANSDIFFDETLNFAEKYLVEEKRVLALTRYEYVLQNNGTYSSHMQMGCDSQDSWIFLPALDTGNMDISFGLGVPGCDNRLASELSKKYEVINPSLSIKTYHVHESNFRTYDPNKRLVGEYLQIHIQ
jgi:hypothetical protein